MTLRQGGDVTLVEPAQLPSPSPAAATCAIDRSLTRRTDMETPLEITFHNMESSAAVERKSATASRSWTGCTTI